MAKTKTTRVVKDSKPVYQGRLKEIEEMFPKAKLERSTNISGRSYIEDVKLPKVFVLNSKIKSMKGELIHISFTITSKCCPEGIKPGKYEFSSN